MIANQATFDEEKLRITSEVLVPMIIATHRIIKDIQEIRIIHTIRMKKVHHMEDMVAHIIIIIHHLEDMAIIDQIIIVQVKVAILTTNKVKLAATTRATQGGTIKDIHLRFLLMVQHNSIIVNGVQLEIDPLMLATISQTHQRNPEAINMTVTTDNCLILARERS